MVSTRLLGLASTVLFVVGALSVGQALHVTVVTGQVGYTSPAFVIQFVLGVVLIALGYRARRSVAEAYDLTSEEADESGRRDSRSPDSSGGNTADSRPVTDDDAAFDPSMSPLGDSAPGDAERDREREARRDGERE